MPGLKLLITLFFINKNSGCRTLHLQQLSPSLFCQTYLSCNLGSKCVKNLVILLDFLLIGFGKINFIISFVSCKEMVMMIFYWPSVEQNLFFAIGHYRHQINPRDFEDQHVTKILSMHINFLSHYNKNKSSGLSEGQKRERKFSARFFVNKTAFTMLQNHDKSTINAEP